MAGVSWCFVCEGSRGKGASGQAAARRCSGLRFATTALRCSDLWPRRKTRFVRCALCAQTVATSQMTIRAAREATGLALLGAPEARRSLPERAFADAGLACFAKNKTSPSRQVLPGGGSFWGGEKRRARVGARSALRRLTRRNCLSAESEANEANFATRPQAEYRARTQTVLRTVCAWRGTGPLARARSEVGAQRRPPQHEPPPGSACRDALIPRPT